MSERPSNKQSSMNALESSAGAELFFAQKKRIGCDSDAQRMRLVTGTGFEPVNACVKGM